MPTKCSNLVAAILVWLFGDCALAQEGTWIVRGGPAYSSITGNESPVISPQPPPLGQETISTSVMRGPGLGVGFEYMWRNRIGLEAAAFLTFHDVDMVVSNDLGTFTATDDTRFRTFTFGANYYFETDGRAQWSLGGFVPLMFADGTDHVFAGLNRTESRAYDQDYGVGIKGGMDWSFAPGSPWTLSIEGRYMFLLTMESESIGDIDVDPAVLSIGVGYRF